MIIDDVVKQEAQDSRPIPVPFDAARRADEVYSAHPVHLTSSSAEASPFTAGRSAVPILYR
jgi:hypothetical protein